MRKSIPPVVITLVLSAMIVSGVFHYRAERGLADTAAKLQKLEQRLDTRTAGRR